MDIIRVSAERRQLFKELRNAEKKHDEEAESVLVSRTSFEMILDETDKGWVNLDPEDHELWNHLQCNNKETCPNERTKWTTIYRFKSMDGIEIYACGDCVSDSDRSQIFDFGYKNRKVRIARDSIEPELLAKALKFDSENVESH